MFLYQQSLLSLWIDVMHSLNFFKRVKVADIAEVSQNLSN